MPKLKVEGRTSEVTGVPANTLRPLAEEGKKWELSFFPADGTMVREEWLAASLRFELVRELVAGKTIHVISTDGQRFPGVSPSVMTDFTQALAMVDVTICHQGYICSTLDITGREVLLEVYPPA